MMSSNSDKQKPYRVCQKSVWLLLLGLSSSFIGTYHSLANAQTSLGAVVVTGTRTEKVVDDAPVRTEVVTREELELTGARTLGEAIENVPGVSLSEIHGKSGYQASLQGLTSDQVLVLVDGLAVTASTGSTVDLSQLLVGDVERIEIIKGAASTQYGSAAMGGVINVITREIRPGISGRIETDMSTRFDQNPSGRSMDAARRHLLASIEGGSKRLRWRVAGDGLRDDGFTLRPAAWPRLGDQIARNRVVARLAWRGSGRSKAFGQIGQYRENDVQRFERFLPPNRIEQLKTEEIERNRVSGGWQQDLGAGRSFSIQAVDEQYGSKSDTFSRSVLVTDREASVRTRQLSAQFDTPIMSNQLWQIGTDLRRESLSQKNSGIAELQDGKVERGSDELFFQNDIGITEILDVVVGARWQRDSDFGSYVAPKISLRHEVDLPAAWRAISRFSAGRGYRVPNLKERFFLFDHSALGYVVIGDPALQPERSDSVQLGLTLSRRNSIRVELNAFHNSIDDLIQVDSTPSGSVNGVQRFEYKNISRARTLGVESGISWTATPEWSFNAGYTYTNAKDLNTGGELTRRPKHLVRLGADWRADSKTTLVTRIRFQSSELVSSESNARSPSWMLFDVALTHRLTRRVTTFLSVKNLLNEQRDGDNQNDFGPRSGRLLTLGLRLNFGANETTASNKDAI